MGAVVMQVMVSIARVPFIAAGCFLASACAAPGVMQPSHALVPPVASASARCLALSAPSAASGADVTSAGSGFPATSSAPHSSIAGESTAVRWASHISRPLRVWIEDASSRAGWDAGDPQRVRVAFEAWEGTGVPLRFTFVDLESDADVVVRWVDRFPGSYDGWTTVRWDKHGWITGGEVRLALHRSNGDPLTPAARQAIATHEVGHVLGLAHATDPDAVMAATVNVTSVTVVDAAAISRLYTTRPAGTLASAAPSRVRSGAAKSGKADPCDPVHAVE